MTSYHFMCLVYFKNIYLPGFFFSMLIPRFATQDCLCFSVTGTRIIYDRKFLLDCRNSPLARTPPCCLPQIPGVTVPATHPVGKLQDLKEEAEEEEKETAGKPHLWASLSALFLMTVTGGILQELYLYCRSVCAFLLHYFAAAQVAWWAVVSCVSQCLGGHTWDSDGETTLDRSSTHCFVVIKHSFSDVLSDENQFEMDIWAPVLPPVESYW